MNAPNDTPKDKSAASTAPNPFQLVPQALAIINEACRLFPGEDAQLVERGEYIAAELTPDFSQAIRAGLFTAADAVRAVRSVLRNPVDEVETDDEWLHWRQRIEAIPAWQRMIAAFEDSERNKVAFPVSIQSMKRAGRPRHDKVRDRVREKKAAGKTWKDIEREMNDETGQNKTAEAYRALLRS